jgi:hypothetical protein
MSLKLFDEINMRNPADKAAGVDLVENGAVTAGLSLRQIMAEQMCEQYQKDRSKKSSVQFVAESSYSFSTADALPRNFLPQAEPPPPLSRQNKNESLANMIKLKQMQEKYESFVDSKMVEEVLENKK